VIPRVAYPKVERESLYSYYIGQDYLIFSDDITGQKYCMLSAKIFQVVTFVAGFLHLYVMDRICRRYFEWSAAS
jgi:hypothetical protein